MRALIRVKKKMYFARGHCSCLEFSFMFVKVVEGHFPQNARTKNSVPAIGPTFTK